VPVRTCIVCGVKAPQRELIRIVRTPGGAVELDVKGKKAGRGAYICRAGACWQEAAAVKGRLAHALKGTVSNDDLQKLLAARRDMSGVSDGKEMQ
jgi:predicted RNA-binding protein YlxR (DUF448 family)